GWDTARSEDCRRSATDARGARRRLVFARGQRAVSEERRGAASGRLRAFPGGYRADRPDLSPVGAPAQCVPPLVGRHRRAALAAALESPACAQPAGLWLVVWPGDQPRGQSYFLRERRIPNPALRAARLGVPGRRLLPAEDFVCGVCVPDGEARLAGLSGFRLSADVGSALPGARRAGHGFPLDIPGARRPGAAAPGGRPAGPDGPLAAMAVDLGVGAGGRDWPAGGRAVRGAALGGGLWSGERRLPLAVRGRTLRLLPAANPGGGAT